MVLDLDIIKKCFDIFEQPRPLLYKNLIEQNLVNLGHFDEIKMASKKKKTVILCCKDTVILWSVKN